MTGNLQQVIVRYPTSFGVWASLLQSITFGVPEIALVGENFKARIWNFCIFSSPFKIYQSATLSDKHFPYWPENRTQMKLNSTCVRTILAKTLFLKQIVDQAPLKCRKFAFHYTIITCSITFNFLPSSALIYKK
jgi:hypothetical protein